MSATYFWHGERGAFQPERRGSPGTIHSPEGPNRRRDDAVRTASEQYQYLKESLLRREDVNGDLSKQTRRAKHLLVVVGALYTMLMFASATQQEAGAIEILGLRLPLSIVQMSAIVPFVMAYLVLFASTISAKRLRIQHECLLIASALEQFGCQTGYSVGRDFKRKCDTVAGGVRETVRRWFDNRLYRMGEYLYDGFVAAAVLLTFGGSLMSAFPLYWARRGGRPVQLLLVLLIGAAGVTLLAPLCLRLSRKGKTKHVEEFVAMWRGGPPPFAFMHEPDGRRTSRRAARPERPPPPPTPGTP